MIGAQSRMTAFAVHYDHTRDAGVDTVDRPRLEWIRIAALECRLARKATPESLCGLVTEADDGSGTGYLRALLRLLPVALDRRMVFRRPGTTDPTFDEAWLLRLLSSVEDRDVDSLIFALASRVPRHFHGQVKFLAGGAIAHLDNL